MNRYIVKEGDTEYSIAQQFGTSVGELRKLNSRLSGSYAGKVGRKIIIP